jgi:hypothetical protein
MTSAARLLRCWLWLAVTCLASEAATAQTDAFRFLMVGFETGSRPERLLAASAMLKHVDYVRATMPTIKPAEAAWVEEERAAISTLKDPGVADSRLMQLHLSAEYQAVGLARALQDLRDALVCAGEKQVPLRREVFCWSVAAYHFDFPDLTYAISQLRSSGRMAKVNLSASGRTGAIDKDEDLAFLYSKGARNIQLSIVIPYLRGDLK